MKDFEAFFCAGPFAMMALRKEVVMSMQKIMDRLSQMPNEPPGTTVVPSPELLAFFVRWCRGLRQWKVSTLAEFASVSVSTIERIERGEQVNDASLDQVAAALGYAPGDFTSPRKLASSDEAYASFAEEFGHMELVNVRPFKRQGQVRALSQCCAYLAHHPGVDERMEPDISNLLEWLDLVSFVRAEERPEQLKAQNLRELYSHVLGAADRLRRQGLEVLVGTIDAPQSGLADWKVAIISMTSRERDPGAPKRKFVFVDRRCLTV